MIALKVTRTAFLLSGCFLASAVANGFRVGATNNRAEQAKPDARKESEKLIYSLKGPDLFAHHCAPCHGSDARGGGPVARALKKPPADLTALAERAGGKFPTERVRRAITGETMAPPHGTREMPVWGPIFHQVEEDRDFGEVRVVNLLKYLESIQTKSQK